MAILLNCCQTTSNSTQFLQPAVIAAIIAGIVSIPGIWMNIRSQRMQRFQSERNEIYKKLNDFYGPMRLLLRNSEELYRLLSKMMIERLPNDEKYRTLPYILEGKKFKKTEKALLKRIIDIGRNIEEIIEKNAGLIDDDSLNEEMIKLSTHIRIIRMAFKGEFDTGSKIVDFFEGKTFPNEITLKVNTTFNILKMRLDELNEIVKKK